MQTIPEIVDYFNDNKTYIKAENRPVFTFADLKKQIICNSTINYQFHLKIFKNIKNNRLRF